MGCELLIQTSMSGRSKAYKPYLRSPPAFVSSAPEIGQVTITTSPSVVISPE